jgi:hypothetical protein
MRVCAAAGVTLLATVTVATAQPRICIPFRDIESIRHPAPGRMVVTTRRGDYAVQLRGQCGLDWPRSYLVIDDLRTGPCLTERTILDTNIGIPCIVTAIRPLAR